MKFYNRVEELNELKTLKENLPSMVVITGKRRVGKTELIKEFLKDKKGLYFFVDNKKSEAMLIDEYMEQIREKFNLEEYITVKSMEQLLKLIFDIAEKEEVIVAIDEFQRFLQINPSFINQIQKYWDMYRDNKKIFFIICGSSIGMIKKIFIESKSPLFKRAQNIIFLSPFSFKEISKVMDDLNIKDIETKIEIFSLFGGNIHFYALIEKYNVKTMDEIFKNLILRKFAPLAMEVSEMMIETFGRAHKTYYSILTAIAMGKGTKKEISDFTKIKETSLSPYIYDLMDLLGIVKYVVPVTEKPEKSKKGRYFLNDNFSMFWFRFIYRNMSYYEIGNYEYIRKKIETEFDSYIGFIFEEICKEFLIELNKRNSLLQFKFSKIGKWWNRKGDEIDIVAINEKTKEILFAECKWTEKEVGLEILNELKEKSKLVEWNNNNRKEYFALFSKSGFKKELQGKALLFDLNDIEKFLC